MTDIRNRLETGFEKLAHTIFKHRLKSIVIMMVMVAVFMSQVPKTTLDMSTEGFLRPDDPYLVAYNAFRDQFGRDEMVIIAMEPAQIFDTGFLEWLKALHEDIEENVPYLDEVTSLINARNTRGNAEELIVEDLLETFPGEPASMARLKQRVMSNAMYKNLLISEDGRVTALVIKTQNYSSKGKEADVLEGFEDIGADDMEALESDPPIRTYLSNEENSAVITAIQGILKAHTREDTAIYLTGSPAVTHNLKASMMRDMRKFIAMAVLTIAVFLLVMFRRISGFVLPLVIVFCSLVSTLGLMAFLGTPIKLPTQILPSFLLAVCVGASVHILAIFFHRFQKTGDKEASIVYALGHSGLACVMTHITTAAGLLSFAASQLAPVADIGLYASFGVMIALIYTLVLLPALLAVLPLKPRRQVAGTNKLTTMDRILEWVARLATQRPVWVLVVSFLIISLSIPMIFRIRFGHDPLRWFPEHDAVRMATEQMDQRMRGTVNLEIILDTGKENGLYDPLILKRLEKAAAYIETLDYGEVFAGKAWSLTAILKEINQALNENQSAYYSIPDNRDVIAQEFLLFENSGSEDLEDVVDSQFSMARFTVKAPFLDALKYQRFMTTIQHYFEESFPEVTLQITGMMPLLFRTLSSVVVSMARSYSIAIVVITLLMIILIGRLRIGLLSMIPNVSPILVMLGVMGAFSLPMDAFTMMVGSIAIGLAVDDTIHFMHNFRRYYEQKGDPVWAVRQTLHTTGRAMLVTTVVLSIGFFIFMLADMKNIFNFGFLTGITIIMALLSDYFIAPALMVLANKDISDK
jgi:hydrophobe/amphiphile efflux-3 (HAE3) family protein